MRELLLGPKRGYGKQQVNLLVSEINVGEAEIRFSGTNAALAEAVSEIKMGTSLKEVPMFISNWCARHDSNVRLLPSEGSTLSS